MIDLTIIIFILLSFIFIPYLTGALLHKFFPDYLCKDTFLDFWFPGLISILVFILALKYALVLTPLVKLLIGI